jgi:hypothetical protein
VWLSAWHLGISDRLRKQKEAAAAAAAKAKHERESKRKAAIMQVQQEMAAETVKKREMEKRLAAFGL